MKTFYKVLRIALAVIATLGLCLFNLIASLGSNPKEYKEYAEKETNVWSTIWTWALKD